MSSTTVDAPPRPGAVASAWLARLGRRAPAVVLALTVAASASVLVAVLVVPERSGGPAQIWRVVTFVAGMTVLAVVGRLVVVRNPARALIGWLLLAVGALGAGGYALTGLALLDPDAAPVPLLWSTNWAWLPGTAAVLLLLLRFPTGALPSAGWRWAERAVLVWSVTTITVTALVPGPLAVTPLDRVNPLGLTGAPWLESLLSPLFGALTVLTLLCATALGVRYRRAGVEERQQLKWVAAATAVLAVAAPVAAASRTAAVIEGAAYLLLPAGLAAAVLRHRLYDLGLVLRRTMAYSITSVLLLGVYVATVTVAQSVLRGRFPDLAATALVAVAAVPALTAVQRGVERLLFGDRRDPDLVVRRLSERLASTPEALLPQVVEQVAHSLRLPYVAVELVDGSTPASSGPPVPAVQRVPLRHRGTTIGWLVAAQRAADEPLGARELKLLQRIASQAGLAVHSSLLSAELRQASQRVQVARSQERARLQRDLHDELGPALGAISMRAEAARNLLRSGQAERVDEVLATIERGAESAVAEVRRLLAELGPQALEDHGLEVALRQAAAAAPAHLSVLVDIAVDRRLPPQVELAAYRISTEALRNVVRHADATTVSLSVRIVDDVVELAVLDDGTGLAPGWQPGVGTSSMRARATEVGGTLELSGRSGRGTALRARLPVVRR